MSNATKSIRERILEQVGSRSRLIAVTVPEWGLDVHVARLDVGEKLDMERRLGTFDAIPKDDRHAQASWRVHYVIEVALDTEGKRIFSPEDESSLLRSEATAIERIVLAHMQINTVTREELKDLGKESAPVLNGASPSA